MKKIITSLVSMVLTLGISLKVYAADTNWASTENVNLTKSQNQFKIEVSVNNKTPYAGGEFGIQCGEGVNVKSVTYSNNSSKAGPTSARGLTWFSFFSGNNDFSGEVKAEVVLEYTGEKNASVVIDNISVYTKNGSKVDTEKFTPRKLIKINREGANNPVDQPNPPDNGGNPGTNPNNPNEGGNGGGSNSGGNTNTGSSTGSKGTSSQGNVPSNGSNQNKDNNEGSNSSESKENTSSDKSNNNDSLTKGNGTKNSGDSKDSQNDNNALLSPVIIALLIISIGANGILGYLIIKNKRKKGNE
jgi:hypothetical protein